MSETVEQPGQTGEQVSEDDLRRMLADTRSRLDAITRERDTERSTRVTTEQERDAERSARLVTEQERDGNAARIVTEAEQRWAAQKDAVTAGIAAQKDRLQAAEESYARYAEAGEWKQAGASQRQIAEAAAKLTNLEAQHEYLETNKEKLVPPAPKPERREVQTQTDRYAQFINGRIEPAEREWLDRRPNFVADPGYRTQVFGASQIATGKGHQRGTEAYFREMEKILGEGAQQQTQAEPSRREDASPQTERAPSADLAPQRRASPGQSPSGGREIKLTADQAEVADGLYGQPNSADYIADQGERYRHYWENMEKRRAQGRM